jgi:hypothetical protein
VKTCTYMHAKLQKEECMKKKIGSDFLTEEIREIAEGELDKDGRLNARGSPNEYASRIHFPFFASILSSFLFLFVAQVIE